MKNIFLAQTDKPSRLYEFGGEYHLQIKSQENFRSQHIYITNDEEIKEGDYGLDTFHKEIRKFRNKNFVSKYDKKIILTTDQDLIKDGVQAIDDEFLEWFVKNPSCESVKVERLDTFKKTEEVYVDEIAGGNYYEIIKQYKIIIPKEEPKPVWKQIIEDCGGEEAFMEAAGLKPKQDRTCSNNCSVVCGECQILEHKQEPCDNCNNDVCCCTIKKQETIEDGANKWVFETNADRWSNNDDTVGDNYGSFIAGAKSDAAKNYWYAKFKDENDQRIKK
jgi:hypothetical protein